MLVVLKVSHELNRNLILSENNNTGTFIAKKSSAAAATSKSQVTEELKKDSKEIVDAVEVREDGDLEGEVATAVDDGAAGDNLEIASPKSTSKSSL